MANDMVAPLQVSMGSSQYDNYFPHDAMLVKQTMRGCLQECLGCEAKSEFEVAPLDFNQIDNFKVSEEALAVPNTLYALENSSCLMRLCWRDGRAFEMDVSQWVADPRTQKETAGTGQRLMNFKKDCGCPLTCFVPLGEDGGVDVPCCCMLPALKMHDNSGQETGVVSKYICDLNLWVPKLQYEEQGQPVYMVKPETCCGGCCIKCSCGGKGCLVVPFYFHDPQSGLPISPGYEPNAPQIRKVWAGLKKECCSTADTYAIKFPEGIDSRRKAGLLGMAFLIDFTVFEKQGTAG